MEVKKISFSFSKVAKKSNILPTTKSINQTANQLELIKCVEDKEIQLVEEKKEVAPLIIPMPENTKTSAALASLLKRRAVLLGEEEDTAIVDDKLQMQELQNKNSSNSLEERAARELLSEVRANDNESTTNVKLVLPILKPDELPLDGAKESTLNDYGDIPVQQFGLAMLRGMGWVDPPPQKKDGIPVDDTPLLRPKGMGLGADKALKPKPLLIPPDANEKLEIKKQACVRILAGKHKDAYGQVEGFDDEHSRVIVKMAIGGAKESFNEFLCQPVSRKEFAEYGKCINSSKYEQYKRLENKHGQIMKQEALQKNIGYKIKQEPREEYATGSKYESKNYREKGRELKQEAKKHIKEEEKANSKQISDSSTSRRSSHYERETEQSYTNGVERDYSQRKQQHEQRRSRSITSKYRDSSNYQNHNRSRKSSIEQQSTDTSKSSEDSDSAYENSSLHKKKFKKKKKSSKKSKKNNKTHKNSNPSDENDSANENRKERRSAKSHKKKTKKSKKPRSRSRSNSRERH